MSAPVLRESRGELRVNTAAAEQSWNDEALASAVCGPRIAFWTCSECAIVLGAGQRPAQDAAAAATRLGIRIVRRQTGGAAVFTGEWLLATSLVLPPSHDVLTGGPARAFELLGDAHVNALSKLGLACSRAEGVSAAASHQAPSVDWACFGSVTPKEIVAKDGRKLVGLAQARRVTGTLVVAGLLLADPDWHVFSAAMGATRRDARSLSERTTSCADLLGQDLDAGLVAKEVKLQLALLLGDESAVLRELVRGRPVRVREEPRWYTGFPIGGQPRLTGTE